MGLFNRVKDEKNDNSKENKNIYDNLGVVEPFTILAGGQFNSFIGALSIDKNKLLTVLEKESFEALWNVSCVDFDGYGNNIWNLKEGIFEFFNENGIIVSFEKKKSDVKDGSEEGRANFVYKSNEGSFVIVQNDRNKKIFSVYVSENSSIKFIKMLKFAEAEALGFEMNNVIQEIELLESDSSKITQIEQNEEISKITKR